MNTRNLFYLIAGLCIIPGLSWGAACSKANLTRCLDSACAINMSSNPAARCQYCGSADAGTPKTAGMRSVSTGSTKYTISDKELKSAPTDPGERYMWTTRKCLTMVSDCTTEDVSDLYDPLIEQSCKAAGINAKMAELQKKITEKKSALTCSNEIEACVVSDTKCGADYSACLESADFDRVFAECAVSATDCDSFTGDIRPKLIAARDSIVNARDSMLDSIVAGYQTSRASRLTNIRNDCKSGAAYNSCIDVVCANNMRGNCTDESEKSMAATLCKFYEIACGTIK